MSFFEENDVQNINKLPGKQVFQPNLHHFDMLQSENVMLLTLFYN